MRMAAQPPHPPPPSPPHPSGVKQQRHPHPQPTTPNQGIPEPLLLSKEKTPMATGMCCLKLQSVCLPKQGWLTDTVAQRESGGAPARRWVVAGARDRRAGSLRGGAGTGRAGPAGHRPPCLPTQRWNRGPSAAFLPGLKTVRLVFPSERASPNPEGLRVNGFCAVSPSSFSLRISVLRGEEGSGAIFYFENDF